MTPIDYTDGVFPFFLSGSAGKLFALYFPPAGGRIAKQAVLYFPPFAEEMNKARRMAVLQARKLVDLGLAVLLVDPFGTGDSEGDFAEARWNIWHDDFTRAADWLSEQGAERLVLWGLRLGTLMAIELAIAPKRWQVDHLVLWQPVVRGDLFMTQFLRLRVAADIMNKQDKLTTGGLRERLKGGLAMEITGYTLAPEMLIAVDALDMETMPSAKLPTVDWIEIAPDDGRQLSVTGQRLLDDWQVAGVRTTAHIVSGEPFWSTPEITTAPALLEKTSELLTGRAA